MAEPWFSDPGAFGAWFGGFGGGVIGLLGGWWGALAARHVPRGTGRGLILGAMRVMIGFGVVSLLIGIIALIARQPYSIYFPMILLGGAITLILGFHYPNVLHQYAEFDRRARANVASPPSKAPSTPG